MEVGGERQGREGGKGSGRGRGGEEKGKGRDPTKLREKLTPLESIHSATYVSVDNNACVTYVTQCERYINELEELNTLRTDP